MNDKLKALIKYITLNSESESRLLYPNPQHYVFSRGLLDKICSIFELEQEEVGIYVDKVNEGKP